MLVKNIDTLQKQARKFQLYRRIPDWFWCETIFHSGGRIILFKLGK